VRFSELASRLTGFNVPLFGVQWTPPTADVTVARQVLAFVEARRVLFSSYTNEVPEHCVSSVIEIRDFLTDTIGRGGIGQELQQRVRLMRRYCIGFLDAVGATEPEDPSAGRRRLFREARWRMHDYEFGQALGQLRAGVGLQVALVAASFGLDVDDVLAEVLPLQDPR
jgi:hypothetical protein